MSESNRSNFEQAALASGLVTEDQLTEARALLRDDQSTDQPPVIPSDSKEATEPEEDREPTPDEMLADRLVELGHINRWQADQLLEGRTKFTLGPYRVVDSIGQGGMGQVFKGEHQVMGRVVALKVLPRSKSTPEAVANFTREIRNLASLDHRRLVRALDAGHDGNVYYLVCEYVPGLDLRKLVRRDGPLDMVSAAKIAYHVAEGLAHAHSEGLIHRDVKPGNVLVTPEGDAKLSDLGLAGPLHSEAGDDPRLGKIVGTADYLAPDHVRSPWDPQPAWDIYSLGCTLYYAVTGKVPFPGGTTSEKARAHLELRPLDPRRLNPELDDEFVDLIADLMAKDPNERIASARDVMRRLRPWLMMKSTTLTKKKPQQTPEHDSQVISSPVETESEPPAEEATPSAATPPVVRSPSPPAPPVSPPSQPTPPPPPPSQPVGSTGATPPAAPPVVRPPRTQPPRGQGGAAVGFSDTIPKTHVTETDGTTAAQGSVQDTKPDFVDILSTAATHRQSSNEMVVPELEEQSELQEWSGDEIQVPLDGTLTKYLLWSLGGLALVGTASLVALLLILKWI